MEASEIRLGKEFEMGESEYDHVMVEVVGMSKQDDGIYVRVRIPLKELEPETD